VQVALMKTIQMLGSGRLDHRTAGLMLYALQTASVNMRQANFEVRDPTKVVIQRSSVQCTSLGDSQWNEDDFQEPGEEEDEEAEDETEDVIEDETENEIEDEAEKQAPVAARSAQSAPARRVPATVKPLTLQETRMQVEGVVRNWLQKNGREAVVKPG
jgi:23S rRNA-/tRNA-specific pseudouridylate synthase